MTGVEHKSEYIGDEAMKMRGVLNLSYPIASGIVQDWDEMEKVLEFCFNNELRTDPSYYNVLITEAFGTPKVNREKMMELMFETFNVNAFHIALQPVLDLYANGRTTGLVVESGDGVTQVMSVFEGHTIPHASQKNHIAGWAVTNYMKKILVNEGIMPQAVASAWHQVIREMKEKIAFIAQNPSEE